IYLFFSSRRRHTRLKRDWSSDVCSADLYLSLIYSKRTYLQYHSSSFDVVSSSSEVSSSFSVVSVSSSLEDALSDTAASRSSFLDSRSSIVSSTESIVSVTKSSVSEYEVFKSSPIWVASSKLLE